jgi:L-threonylcarbamoyladenylate synthase
MNIIRVNEKNIKDILTEAVRILEKGGIIAYPTETFYGIGAKFDLEASLKRIYELKSRPPEKAMPLIIGQRQTLSVLASHINDKALRLMERFWPGPLTILLPANKTLSEYIVSEGKVAVRIPGESFALSLAKTAGFPITATSANLSGMPPAEDAETVIKYFGENIDLIIDGGKTPGGLPSTIVDTTEDEIKILRQGAIRINSV